MVDSTSTSIDISCLKGRILVAAPGHERHKYRGGLICVSDHTPRGAYGFFANRPDPDIAMPHVLRALNLLDGSDGKIPDRLASTAVMLGGPVSPGRGFVIHTTEYDEQGNTTRLRASVSVTNSKTILQAMVDGSGPARAMLVFGALHWRPGEIEAEIREGRWLIGHDDEDIIFGDDVGSKYEIVLRRIGIEKSRFFPGAGHA